MLIYSIPRVRHKSRLCNLRGKGKGSLQCEICSTCNAETNERFLFAFWWLPHFGFLSEGVTLVRVRFRNSEIPDSRPHRDPPPQFYCSMRHTQRPTFLYHNHNRRDRLHTLCHCPPTLRVDQFLPAPRAFSYNTDLGRLRQLIPRISVLLLGSCALTGNPFAVDRHVLARKLRFQSHRKQSVRCGQCSEEPSHTYQTILFGVSSRRGRCYPRGWLQRTQLAQTLHSMVLVVVVLTVVLFGGMASRMLEIL